jgi:hypothetical protein
VRVCHSTRALLLRCAGGLAGVGIAAAYSLIRLLCVLKQLSDRSLKRARRCDLRMLMMRDRKKRPVLESALADGTMATRLPERKTRHIPFLGQLFIIYTNPCL